MLKKLLWLSRRSKNQANTTSSSPSTPTAAIEAALLPNSDEADIQARLHWQLGEWQELFELSQRFRYEDAKGEAAAFFAAACGQLGFHERATHWAKQALQAGVPPSALGNVLISGVYGSLGQARLIQPESTEAAVRHFETASHLGLGNQKVPSLTNIRVKRQLERYGNAASLSSSTKRLTHSYAARLPSLSLHYRYYDDADIWVKPGERSIEYSDGDAVEEKILSVIRNAEDLSLYSDELRQQQTDWPSRYHLSADRVNLLRPFAQSLAGAAVLELGCGCGAITRYLGELGAQVIAVEGSQRRAHIAAARCRDLDNVSVVADRLQNLPFENSFDVVTLIGVLEYSRVYVESVDPIQAVLQRAKRYLKPNGVLIVAIENQLGLKYFAGAPEDHGLGVMAGINNLYHDKTPVTFGHQTLTHQLKKAGFSAIETHLPFPDYKMPALVVSPRGQQPYEGFNLATLLRTAVALEPQPIKQPLFSLEQAWPLIEKNGLLADMANSHLLVASASPEITLADPQVLASYYSPKRTAAFSQQVEFLVRQGNGTTVRRKRLGDTQATLNAFNATDEPYVQGEVHADALHRILQRPGWQLEELLPWFNTWYDALKANAFPPDESVEALGWVEYDAWLPSHFIDAIPRNLVIKPNGETEFIDLEWAESHPIPLQLVLYRGLNITFNTLTSIAEPSSTELLDTHVLSEKLLDTLDVQLNTLDYSCFMPVLDNLIRRAQGVAPLDAPPTKPYPPKQLFVRRQQSTPFPSTMLTLYWCYDGIGYNENDTVKKKFRLDGKVVSLYLPLPNDVDINGLRFDIAGCPGYFFIHELAIKNAENELLWAWDLNPANLLNSVDITYFAIDGQPHAGLLSTSHDPRFELPIEKELIEQLPGAQVHIVFHSAPPPAENGAMG
jgi:SAM-dependent methyltransferase